MIPALKNLQVNYDYSTIICGHLEEKPKLSFAIGGELWLIDILHGRWRATNA